MMKPLVTVIMPVYNAEAFVAEAIDSVLAQTYPSWELIVVDDGSTDASPEILKRHTDPRIVTIRQQNKGEGGARNTGLERAKGEYIGFLDADDMFLPTALEQFVAFLDGHPDAGVVFADGTMIDANGAPLMLFSELRGELHTGYILEPLVLQPTVVSGPLCMMARKSAIDARHTRFDENLRYGVDWDFWTELARFHRYDYLASLVGCYRVHGKNMTSSVSIRKRKEDVLVGRLKIMNSDWFDDLSVRTRADFFFYVLIDLLAGQPDRQHELIQSPQFGGLPAVERCRLLRLVASSYLRQRSEEGFAKQCLERAQGVWPTDRKTALLLRLMHVGGPVCSVALSTWHTLRQAKAKVHAIGRTAPRPVPVALRPPRD